MKFPGLPPPNHHGTHPLAEHWDKFSHGWKKWDPDIKDFLQFMGNAMIYPLQLKYTDVEIERKNCKIEY